MQLNPAVRRIAASPISVAKSYVPYRAGRRPFLDLSQAAPSYPPAPVVEAHIAATAHDPAGARYAPVMGLPGLRQTFSQVLSADYRGTVEAQHVHIVAGCNQAFCSASSALAGPGDEIIVVSPYYFNHVMWLQAQQITPVLVPIGADGLLSPAELEAKLTNRTRAILLVSPGNPTGLTITADTIAAVADLARSNDIALILDETYRNFRDSSEPAHDLFAERDWTDTLISLHSFSKDLAIPGYRVGAIVAGTDVLEEVAKIQDCVAISAPTIGQEAALIGLQEAGEWRCEQVDRILGTLTAFRQVMAGEPGGFKLVHSGAFFGWVKHPFETRSTDDVVRTLVTEHDALAIPGTAFTEGDEGFIRCSFANLEPDQLTDFAHRLTKL
ncbi:MAG: aminotransferase [Acidimicrobiales bacterium]